MDEKDEYITKLETEITKQRSDNANMSQAVSTASMFSSSQDPNLIEFQLELNDILERIERLLKGQVVQIDSEGNVRYVESKDKNLRTFNDFGVQFLMDILSFYLNRNTILTFHTEERISKIIYDIGYEISDQIYLNHKRMGLDTPEKRRRYPLIVLELIHTIENVYNRALQGGERKSLRTMMSVNQSIPFTSNPAPQEGKRFSLIKPWTWV